MRIETLSTFPEIFDSYMNVSIMKIAQTKNILRFNAYNLRDWTSDLHHTTDDKPYGGGCGQLMMCEPIFKAYDDISSKHKTKPYTIFLAPFGKKFNDKEASFLSERKSLLFICGHYEGIDYRAYNLADQVYSIGDYVVTGGEISSLVIIDSVVRKLPGVLGASNGPEDESFVNGILESPQYTRPSSFRGMNVPDVLLSGNHKLIKEWKNNKSIELTKKYRPDLLNED